MTGDQHPLDSNKRLTEQLDIDFALRAAGLGVWEIDPATNKVYWDDRCRALVGLAKDDAMPFEEAIQYIHPDDLNTVMSAIQRAMTVDSGGSFDQTYRTLGADGGKLRWVRFWGQAYFTPSGELSRFSGIAQEVTQFILARQAATEREAQLKAIIDEAPTAICLFAGPDMVVQRCNKASIEVLGRGADIVGKPLREVMPEIQDQPFLDLLASVYTTQQPFRSYNAPVNIVRDGVSYDEFYNINYVPLLDDTGQSYAVLGIAVDVTGEVEARRRLVEQEAQLQGIIQQTPAPTLVLRGDEYRIDQINPPMLAFMGRSEDIIGRPFLTVMPELAGQFAWQQVQRVYEAGVPVDLPGVLVPHVRDGVMQDIYYDIAYRPLREAGQITGMIQVAIDVTEQMLARQKVEESETRLRSLIAAAPAGIGLYVGRDLIIENPNQTFIDIVGKGPSIEGLPLREAMPELLTEGQPFLEILDNIFTTGVPFNSPASLVRIVQNGVLNDNYYNIAYVPIRNTANAIYAILAIGIDVTEQVQAQQALKESQDALHYAIELAELGTFSVDIVTNLLTVSSRVADWFGFDSLAADTEAFINGVGERDRERVRTSLANALLPGSEGRYDVVHSVVNAKTGHQIIIHALGQVFFDTTGNPLRIQGTAQDITVQQRLQQFLEQQVQQRTEELAAGNEELAASNEELAATNEELAANNEEYVAINEELEESNLLLNRSNDNLQTFAYIASHDLQEPLRKIQQFGDLLKTRLTGSVGDEEMAYLERMQVAASRMSTLIRDLLSYSRISTQRNTDESVYLDDVLRNVLSVLDLAVIETKAQVQVGALPVVSGDGSQLGQLFQNLLSNALKFRRPDVPPQIRISSQLMSIDQLPPGVKPARRTAAYHRIDVADNGIGFDEKYLDRIFQVFQRLHGKSQYTGTGVGLAICEKVVTNHGGVITAHSQPGQGTTFVVYLPADN